MKIRLVRPPGFEPGSAAWQAAVLVQARLRPPLLYIERVDYRFFLAPLSSFSIFDKCLER